jgi:hypothetical protein
MPHHKKSRKKTQKTLKNLNTLKKHCKNLQKTHLKRKSKSIFKNIKINIDRAMTKGEIPSLLQLSNTISFLIEIGKVYNV